MKNISLLSIALFGVAVMSAQEQLNDSLAMTALDEVVVESYFGGLSKALKQQKNSFNITNVVTADQAGKYPDDNIGDAIKRISGISVQNDQGEARNIVMRGFGTQLNSVTLNGDRLPSAEGDNRNIQLDLIPTNMIESIVVKKSLTPDMEGDAIGGSVNLITRSNPNAFRASATISGGGNPIREGGYNSNFALLVADQLSDKFSYTLSSSIQTRDYGSDNVEFAWNDPADWNDVDTSEIEEMDIRRYDVKRTRRSVSLNLDYNINKSNSLFFKSIYNHRDDWENRFRWRAQYEDQELKIRKQTKGGIDNDENKARRLEDQRLEKYSLGGEHQAGNVAIDWKVSTAVASEHRPDERYTRYEYKGVPYNGSSPWDITNPERPYLNFADESWNDDAEYKYKKTEETQKFTEEKNKQFKINFELPYGPSASLKFGAKYKDQFKSRDDIWFEHDMGLGNLNTVPTFAADVDSYEPGAKYVIGNFMDARYLGGLALGGVNGPNFDSYVMDEFAGANYSADETITAGYLMTTNNIGPNTVVVAGFRVEHTALSYVGQIFDEETGETPDDISETTGSKDYANVLPSINIRHNFTNDFNLTLAYSKSLARPDYYDLVPYQYSNSDDNKVEFGNSSLEATAANNFDLMAEKYIENTGILSGGLFYKSIDNWIYTYSADGYTYNGVSDYKFTQKRNGKNASVFGFEVALQKQLSDNLNLAANYTFTDSDTDSVEGRTDVPLVGAVENIYNVSLAYEAGKIFVRASYNYAGEQLDELGGDTWEDRFYDEQKFLDLNATYSLTDKIRLFAEAKNLTNQPLRYYQGVQERTMQIEFYQTSWNIGLKIDL
jgi:TonB-dependent receptor